MKKINKRLSAALLALTMLFSTSAVSSSAAGYLMYHTEQETSAAVICEPPVITSGEMSDSYMTYDLTFTAGKLVMKSTMRCCNYITVKNSSGSAVFSKTVGPNDKSCRITGLTPGKKYTVTVRTFFSNSGSLTASMDFSTPVCTAGKDSYEVAQPNGEDIVARALYLAELRPKYYNDRSYDFTKQSNPQLTSYFKSCGIDCSALINYTLGTLGIETRNFFGSSVNYLQTSGTAARYHYIPSTTHGWNTRGYDLDGITKKVYWVTSGSKKQAINVVKNGEMTWDLPYWKMRNGKTIPVGTVILALAYNTKSLSSRDPGGDHMWIYMGNFPTKSDAQTYAARLMNKKKSAVTSRISPMYNGETHWRIESTGTNHGFGKGAGVQINDHLNNYDYIIGDDYAGDARYYKIYAFAPPTY